MRLTPPRLITFAMSLVLIGLAVASMYMKIPTIGTYVSAHRFGFLVAAYVVLALGVAIRSF